MYLCSNIVIYSANVQFQKDALALCSALGIKALIVSDTDFAEDTDKILIDSSLVTDDMIGPKFVLILEEGESVQPFMDSFESFIFDAKDKRQLGYALYAKETGVIEPVKEKLVVYKDCEFDFEKDVYLYKGVDIYLTRAEKKLIKELQVKRARNSTERAVLFRARKRHGKDFFQEEICEK